jgi:hypothetical protein
VMIRRFVMMIAETDQILVAAAVRPLLTILAISVEIITTITIIGKEEIVVEEILVVIVIVVLLILILGTMVIEEEVFPFKLLSFFFIFFC